ncbi:MAG: PadR family transcriptional regulator [Candidatus Bathyarchaeota archaeon]|nr:PadR family transcriptional regulator [Candidatus Bathyarchaeota archaeon]MDH5788264.1 PadR family transcriptional regulator [Candidatus Bathyarchaeota archaeon]
MQQDEETAASNWLKEIQKGYIRIATLILLSKKPHHGYEIMKEIKERTKGFWKPTAGGIYPILKDLQKSGYIQGEWNDKTRRRKKIYIITKTGRTVLRRSLAKENQLAVTMRNLFEEYMKGVLEVDTQLDQTLRIPLPLSELLRETDEKKEDTIRRLEEQRRQIQGMIKQLQKKLGTITKRLRTLKRHTS